MKMNLQSILSYKIEDKFAPTRDKCMNFINAHPELFCILLLTISCLIFLFLGLGAYPLMDVDETRYAVMSRDLANSYDWNALMLNSSPFLEKPPLYFWLVASSIKLFGQFNPLIVRLPIALLSAFLVFFTYYLGKRVISRKFGMISALILLSSAFFLILSHIAIIDMVLTVFMTSAIYCAFLTHFSEDKNRKYYWWYFYLFVGLGFLAKGILAFAIPVLVVFLYNLATRTLKDVFKPINLLPGLVIFFAIITPWHMVMYNQYGYQFVKEYFLLHHFARFVSSEVIGRQRPFLYFVPVFLLGFMPWAMIFLGFLWDGCKKLVARFKAAEGQLKDKLIAIFEATNNEQKLVLFAAINFVVIFLLFSSSSTKLPTYILPVFPAASLLTGYYWWVSDERGEHEKLIYNSTLIFALVFILAAFGASISYNMLPETIQYKMSEFKELTIVAIYLLEIFLVLRLNTKRALSVFSGYIFSMLFVIILSVSQIFNFVYATGENEIVRYSTFSSNASENAQLVTFDFAVKPSVLINYKDRVNFVTDANFNVLDSILKFEDGPTFVIVKNKNFEDDMNYRDKLVKRLKLIQSGERYSLYVKDVNNEYSAYGQQTEKVKHFAYPSMRQRVLVR